MRKQNVLLCGLLLLMTLLAACGIPEGKPEDEIVSEITSADSYLAEYGLTVDSSVIRDREIDEEQKAESMKMDIKASNDYFSYEASYDIHYIVEDGSWVLGEWKKTGDSYLAAAPATKEDVETALAGKYDTTAYVSDEGEGNEYSFKYTASKKGKDVAIDYDLTIPFAFTPDDGWKAGTVKVEESGFSGACGESLTWSIDKTGELAIKGNGAMADYSKEKPAPWNGLPEQFSVKAVAIEDGLTHLGAYAFSRCNKLTNLSIPVSVNSAGAAPFEECNELKEISYDGSRARWNAYLPALITDDMQVTIKSAVSNTEIVNSGTCGEKLAWTLDIDGLLTIAGEGKMAEYTIYPEPIGTDALPANPINSAPWGKQTGDIKSVVVERGATTISDAAFSLCKNLTTVDLPDGIKSIGTWSFLFCGALSDVNVPNSVSELGFYAFCGCEKLSAINIPEGIELIGWSTFEDCKNLKQLKLPSTLREIFDMAFGGCSGLSEVAIPEGVTHLQGSVFSNCTGLTSITLPVSLNSDNNSSVFGSAIFASCTNIRDIHYLGTKQQWEDRKMNVFEFGSNDYTIHFNDGQTFRYYIHSPALSQDEAGKKVCDYLGLSYDSLDETPYEGAEIEFREQMNSEDGRCFYLFEQMKWILLPGGTVPNRMWIAQIYIDAETGECYDELP